jgi:hypothetical protein
VPATYVYVSIVIKLFNTQRVKITHMRVRITLVRVKITLVTIELNKSHEIKANKSKPEEQDIPSKPLW